MRRSWHIARLDIRRMVRDRTFFFWSLAFPILLILIFGNLYRGEAGPPKAGLIVVNHDTGQWGEYLTEKLKTPSMIISGAEAIPDQYNRCLVIPADFSDRIQKREAQKLLLRKNPDASSEAATQVEIRIIQALVRMITEIMIHPEPDAFFSAPGTPLEELVTVRSGFPPGTLTVIPSGFDHVIPGILIQMIMMLVLIYGGITVMEDRQHRILARILFSPASIAQLWTGKFWGRFLAGLLQAMLLLGIGLLFFRLNLGNPFLSIPVILVFCAAISALSIFLGSVFRKEQVIVGLAILLSNLFAALGGCWWPLEVVSPAVRTLGMVTPSWWAMDALHKVIFFKQGLDALWVHFLILFAFTAFFSLLSVRFFKIQD